MSLLTAFYDYYFLDPLGPGPNLDNYAYTGYSSKQLNEIQKQFYYISKLFLAYNNLLLVAKSVNERKLVSTMIDDIFKIIISRGAKEASELTKEQLYSEQVVSVFGKRRNSKLKTEFRKQIRMVFE